MVEESSEIKDRLLKLQSSQNSKIMLCGGRKAINSIVKTLGDITG